MSHSLIISSKVILASWCCGPAMASGGRYTPQVLLYAYAMEELLGWKIGRSGLFFTDRMELVDIPCGRDRQLALIEGVWRILGADVEWNNRMRLWK